MSRTYASAGQRRDETVSAVIRLAACQDPAALTTAQIAAAMGLSQGALFRHFPDKASIWAAVMEWTATELDRRFDSVEDGSPLERLGATLGAHVDFVVASPGVPRILFCQLQRPGDTPAKSIASRLMAGYRARVARELFAARDAGDIASGTDVEAATVMALAMMQGMVMQGLAIDALSALPAMSRRLFGLFLQSLGAGRCG